jgi:hypothetical protein
MKVEIVSGDSFPYFDRYRNNQSKWGPWKNPHSVMAFFRNSRCIAYFGYSIIDYPDRLLLIDPIHILPKYRGTLVFTIALRKLKDFCSQNNISKFMFMVMKDLPYVAKIANRLGCTVFGEDQWSWYALGNVDNINLSTRRR